MFKRNPDSLGGRLRRRPGAGARLDELSAPLDRATLGTEVSLAELFIAADQSSHADTLRGIDSHVPTGTMAQFAAVARLYRVFVPDQLLTSNRMLALHQALELLGRDFTGQAESFGEWTANIAGKGLALAEIVIRSHRILLLIVGLGFAGRQRFGYINHSNESSD